MKISKKLRAALERRLQQHTDRMPSGMACKRPGSQNRKKGCSAKNGRRH